MDIEYMADMFIMLMCFSIIGYYIGQYVRGLYVNYLSYKMDKKMKDKGFDKVVGEDGVEWYIGYGWPYDN